MSAYAKSLCTSGVRAVGVSNVLSGRNGRQTIGINAMRQRQANAPGPRVCISPVCSANSPVMSETTNSTDSSKVTFSSASPMTRIAAGGCMGTMCAFIGSDAPSPLRAVILAYMAWAGAEFVIHRYFMHAKYGSFGDRFSPMNKLHVVHHAETNKVADLRRPCYVRSDT